MNLQLFSAKKYIFFRREQPETRGNKEKTAVSSRRTAAVFCFCLVSVFFSGTAFAQNPFPYTNSMTSVSRAEWDAARFSSGISMDVEKAGIVMPADRGTAVNRINMNLPLLLKDALLSLPVDSSVNLGDAVLQGTITLSQLTNIIDEGKRTPSFFSAGMDSLNINHSIALSDIGGLLVGHTVPYTPDTPLETVPSRPYTGIIIDARGNLPVQGEYTSAQTEPCFFPKVWDENMNLIYERNMVFPETAKRDGIVAYSDSIDEKEYRDRIGRDPLHITARKVYGINRTDPVISRADALKILGVPENLELLKNGRVVILIDTPLISYEVHPPVKEAPYYVTYRDIAEYFRQTEPDTVSVSDTYKGITITVNDLRFKADSPELLPEENDRLDTIAEALKTAVQSFPYTILVEGHTADVGKPAGQLELSIQRAQKIIDEMVSRGVPAGVFSYIGHGGTIPIAPNDTNEGRALNRRVEITLQPKIQ